MAVYTVGHSTRSLEEFLNLLKRHDVRRVADVRRFPSSRKFPHFNRGELEKSLPKNGIEYVWMERLGGRRHGQAAPDSPNAGLRTPAFRNYADYMLTAEFHSAINELLAGAEDCSTAIMCAERLHFRCHRMLISDYLTMSGVEVFHLGAAGCAAEDSPIPHKYTSCAKVRNDTLTYLCLSP
jgi:uncharacterized protein (DUF488 family)